MPKRVVFSPLANRDLESIWSYLAEECENPRAASKVIDSILSRVELLSVPVRSWFVCRMGHLLPLGYHAVA